MSSFDTSDDHKTRLDFSKKLPASTLYSNIVCPPPRYSCDSYIKSFEDWFCYLSHRDEWERDTFKPTGRTEFHYIMYGLKRFHEIVEPYLNKGAKSFIDVGCGGGDKLAYVKEHWPDVLVVGVEHDPCMAAWAGAVGDVVFCMDAAKVDYEPYDVIYAYWPICNGELMIKLIEHIVRTKREEATFVLVGFGNLGKDLRDKVVWR